MAGNNASRFRHLKINGSGSSAGGHFDKVIIRGEGEVIGDLECAVFKVMGTTNVLGQLQAKQMQIMGTTQVEGGVVCDEIKLTGELSVKEDCSAEIFKSRGAFTIGGLLNAGQIEIGLHGFSHAREIGGDRIYVKPHLKLFPGGARELTAETIEGDDIRLEYTKAKVVRGNHVNIGPGCEIELVEYKETFHQANTANVTTSRQL